MVRLTVQYQVPDLRELGHTVPINRVVSNILSGWGIGVYLNYQSAALIGRPTSNGSVPISQFLGYGPGSAQLKTDGNGNYMNPWSVDWTDYDGKHHTDPIDINCHCFDPTKTVVLNPNAWENIPNGQFGAQQDDLRFYPGSPPPDRERQLQPQLPHQGTRQLQRPRGVQQRLQPDADPHPSTAGNFAGHAATFTAGANAGLYSGGFGTIVPMSGTSGMRTGQIIARITF